MGKVQHVKALLLPILVILVIPALILQFTQEIDLDWFFPFPFNSIPPVVGSFLIGIGLAFLIKTNQLFVQLGKGTLAPWDPPKHLVVCGIYRHVRNPMIWGVLITLIGESVLFSSIYLLLVAICFFTLNHIYFIKSEEPALIRRFGEDYLLYEENVPRWIPRVKPWRDQTCQNSETNINEPLK